MASAATRTVDSEFAELICDDPEWLRAEFDALISAVFGEPPVPPPAAPPGLPPDRDAEYPVSGPWTDHLVAPALRPLVITARARQRAPPL
jgi:hypothetical protein